MNKLVIFIQGGGEDGYEADKELVASLRKALGETYTVHYPPMPSVETLPDFGWIDKIDQEVSSADDNAILVAHSLGASMLLKYLSQTKVEMVISGVFLIATPDWSGDEQWKQGLKLHKGFGEGIPKSIPVFLYQCLDDEVVSFSNLEFYMQNLPQATVRIIQSGGHQLNNDLSLVAADIRSL